MPRISPTPSSGSGIDDTMLKSQVYYQTEVLDTSKSAVPPPEQLVSDPADIARIFAADILSGTTVEAPPTQILTYIKSEYAGAYGIEIEKRYSDISGSPVRS